MRAEVGALCAALPAVPDARPAGDPRGRDRAAPVSTTVVPLNWYAVVLVVAALSSYLLTFPVRHLAAEIGYVAQPDDRKVHQQVTPRAGGVAMFVALLVAWAVAASIPALAPLFRNTSEPLGLILGAAAIFVVGVIDDLRDMSAPAKMAGQVLAATILYFLGRHLVPVQGPPGRARAPLAAVDAAVHRPLGHRHHQCRQPHRRARRAGGRGGGHRLGHARRLRPPPAAPGQPARPTTSGRSSPMVTCGICLGFLPHNFHPARIFMGDAGALLLGLLMAASTMLIGGRADGTVGGVAGRSGETYFFFAPLFIPFFILGVPIVDMAFAFLRRTANRTGFSTPDKNHLHHRLLRLGHGHRRSVLILWAWTVLLSGFILFPLYISSVNAFIPFGALALGVILYTLFHPSLRKAGRASGRRGSSGRRVAG